MSTFRKLTTIVLLSFATLISYLIIANLVSSSLTLPGAHLVRKMFEEKYPDQMKKKKVIISQHYVADTSWAKKGKQIVVKRETPLLSSPFRDAKILQKLKEGTLLTIIEKRFTLYKVRLSDKTEGWVNEDDLTPAKISEKAKNK